MSASRLPPKKEVLTKLLEQWSVMVYLDPRAPDVRVPSWFKKQPQLALQIGLNLPVPIRDLQIDDEGLSCTLSFNRSPHFCFVSWSAVFALVGEDGRGMVWPESVPPEITVAQQGSGRSNQGSGRSNTVQQANPPQHGGSQQSGAEPQSGAQLPTAERKKRASKRASRRSTATSASVESSAADALAPQAALKQGGLKQGGLKQGGLKQGGLKAVPGGASEAASVPAAAIGAHPQVPTPVEPAAQPRQKAPRPSYLRVVK